MLSIVKTYLRLLKMKNHFGEVYFLHFLENLLLETWIASLKKIKLLILYFAIS